VREPRLLAANFPHIGAHRRSDSRSPAPVHVADAPAPAAGSVHASPALGLPINLPWRAGGSAFSHRPRAGDRASAAVTVLLCAVLANWALGVTFASIEAGGTAFSTRLRPPYPRGPPVLALYLFVKKRKKKKKRIPQRSAVIPLALFLLRSSPASRPIPFLLWAGIQAALFFVPFRPDAVQGFGPLRPAIAPCLRHASSPSLSRWAGVWWTGAGPSNFPGRRALLTGLAFSSSCCPARTTSYALGSFPPCYHGDGRVLCAAPVTVVALNSRRLRSSVGIASAVTIWWGAGGGSCHRRLRLALSRDVEFPIDRLPRASVVAAPAAVTALAPNVPISRLGRGSARLLRTNQHTVCRLGARLSITPSSRA